MKNLKIEFYLINNFNIDYYLIYIILKNKSFDTNFKKTKNSFFC